MGLLFTGTDSDSIKAYFCTNIPISWTGWENDRSNKCMLIMGFQIWWVWFCVQVSPDSLFVLCSYRSCYYHTKWGAGLFLLFCCHFTEQSLLCCTVLSSWSLLVGSHRSWLCPGKRPFVTGTSELHSFPCCYFPAHTVNYRTHHYYSASTALQVLLCQMFRMYTFLNGKYCSYWWSSNITQCNQEKKKRQTSVNFLSTKWLFSRIWSVFQLQAWFSN